MTLQDINGAQAPTSTATPPRRRRALGDVLDVYVTVAASTVALAYVWLRRNEGDIDPETGLGYALGIIGGTMMLMLLVYPLRKRLPALRHLGAVRSWFRMHMILGVAGPVLIVMHSNFHIGSLNSLAAMTAMLIVAGSGFVGRFFYARIHRGLYGQKLTLQNAQAEVAGLRAHLPVAVTDWVAAELASYEARRLDHARGFLGSMMLAITAPVSHLLEHRRLMRHARQDAGGKAGSQALRTLRQALRSYMRTLARAEAFTVYDRLFAAWHMLHLPLFVILVVAALAHVLAVHMY